MMIKCIYLQVLAFMAFIVCSNAETTNEQPSNVIIVTARGIPKTASETPGGTAVITKEKINEYAPSTVADLFVLTPSVNKVSDGYWASDISIRGLSRDSVVMLVDGVRVNTATDLGARLSLMNPQEIEKIEILKGPITSLYGSGTIGGVINVITKTGKYSGKAVTHCGVLLSVEDNPLGFSSSAFYNNNGPDKYIYVSQSYRDYDSYKSGNGDDVSNSQFSDFMSKVDFGYKLSEFNQLILNVQYFEADETGIPGAGTAPLPKYADVTYKKATRLLTEISELYKRTESYESVLSLSYQRIYRDVMIDNMPKTDPLLSVNPEGTHDSVGARWLNNIRIDDNEISAGVDVWQRSLETTRERITKAGKSSKDIPIPDSTFMSSGVFAEDTYKVREDFKLSVGARGDLISVHNDKTTQWKEKDTDENAWNAHLGAVYNPKKELSLKAIYANGYRAASLEERYQYLQLGGGKVKLGDPELKREHSSFTEIGADWDGDRCRVSVSAYVNRLTDMIGEKKLNDTTFVNANIDEARISGAEASVEYELPADFSVFGNIAYIEGKDTRDDTYLSGIAPLSGMAGIKYSINDFWAICDLEVAGKQNDVPAGIGTLPGWGIIGIRSGWTFSKTDQSAQNISLSINNLLDKYYRNYLTTYRGDEIYERGRSISLSYGWQF